MNVTALANRGKKRFAFQGRTHAFHDLPEPILGALRNFLEAASRLPKDQYSYARTWLGQLPPTPKEAGHLLLELDLEQALDEAEEDDASTRVKAAPQPIRTNPGSGQTQPEGPDGTLWPTQ